MKATPLAVSGAFHTPLMQPAREALVEVSSLSIPAKAPSLPSHCTSRRQS